VAVYRSINGKKERSEAAQALQARVKSELTCPPNGTVEADPDAAAVSSAFKRVESGVMRGLVLKEGYRADGRGIADVRPIWSRAGVLPRTHGSALFTRGETQALAVTTLGSEDSTQRVDSMASSDDEGQRFYLQYSFPPSSVGETGRMGGPGRREIGHGDLAGAVLKGIFVVCCACR
jgi:polyribonucleotide nucleotidyltransferase